MNKQQAPTEEAEEEDEERHRRRRNCAVQTILPFEHRCWVPSKKGKVWEKIIDWPANGSSWRDQSRDNNNMHFFINPKPFSFSPSLFLSTMTDSERESESEGEIRASIEPSSPDSSGYAGEGRGSTSATSGSQFEIEQEDDMRIEIDRISISDSHTTRIPDKRHFNECRMMLPYRGGKGRSISSFLVIPTNLYILGMEMNTGLQGFQQICKQSFPFVENGYCGCFSFWLIR